MKERQSYFEKTEFPNPIPEVEEEGDITVILKSKDEKENGCL